MSTDVSSLTLDVVTWKCLRCGVSKYLNYYSMQSHMSDQTDHVCNSCRIKKDQLRFDRADAPSIEWMKDRNCSEEQAELFFPTTSKNVSEALWEPICGGCSVRDQCLEFGRQTASQGVWGGVLLEPVPVDTRRIGPKPLSEIPEDQRGNAGRTLMKRGSCARGHEIRGPQDIYTYWSKTGNKRCGGCLQCERRKHP